MVQDLWASRGPQPRTRRGLFWNYATDGMDASGPGLAPPVSPPADQPPRARPGVPDNWAERLHR